MDEYKQYLENQNLAETTIRNHIRNLGAYENAGFSIDDDEDKTLDNLKTYEIGSKRQTMVSTISKYRTYKKYDNEKIRTFMVGAVQDTLKINDTNNQAKDIPSITIFRRKMKDYFVKTDYASCAILYLLLTFNVRNADLNVTIMEGSRAPDKINNYLMLGKKSVMYVRNDYKTYKKYGQKKHRIVHKMFVDCVRALHEFNRTLIDRDPNNITRVVKKITGGYTEADLMKRAVFEAKGLREMTKISNNRGTSLDTMSASYDISKV